MEYFKVLIGWVLTIFISFLAIWIVVLVLRKEIKLEKLISEQNGDASFSRFQFLIFTFVISMSLFLIVISGDKPSFPKDIPPELLWLLGISGGSYVVSKGIQSSRDITLVKKRDISAVTGEVDPMGDQVLPQPPVASGNQTTKGTNTDQPSS